MALNKYEGCIEQWKVDLIVRRARVFGFGEEDIRDIQQELVLKLMGFEYDVNKSNGAQEATVIQAVIDNELKMRRRIRQRWQEILEAMQWILETSAQSSKTLLSVDIKKAMLHLPEKQRQICIALSKGFSTNEIAKILRVSQRTIQRHIRKIRDYFEAVNLHHWLTL
jgi:RNA polymerase sigma factor (sigma-70 family)